eukprot:15318765-Alexandrium_andersonii.AAC.1
MSTRWQHGHLYARVSTLCECAGPAHSSCAPALPTSPYMANSRKYEDVKTRRHRSGAGKPLGQNPGPEPRGRVGCRAPGGCGGGQCSA